MSVKPIEIYFHIEQNKFITMLIQQLKLIKANLEGKYTEPNLQLLFGTFIEGCLQGYAEKLTEKQVEKVWELLSDIQGWFDDREMTPFMIDDCIECFRNAVGAEEDEPGYRW